MFVLFWTNKYWYVFELGLYSQSLNYNHSNEVTPGYHGLRVKRMITTLVSQFMGRWRNHQFGNGNQVMTGGWFMTLFKPHYLIIQKLWYPCFSILIPNHKCMGYIAIHNSPFILFLELDLAHQTHKKSKLSMSSHQTSNFSFRLDIRPRNWLSNIINCGLCHHQITDHINSYQILSCYIPMLSPWLLFPPKFRKIDASDGEMREPLQHENHVTINHQVFADGFYMGSSHVMPGKNPQPPIRYCT